MLTLYLDLNISVLEGGAYGCVADGYPDIQLVMWQTGLGTDSHHNTTIERFEFHVVTSVLAMGRDELCRESEGYLCTFSNGDISPIVQSATVNCIPGNYYMQLHALCNSLLIYTNVLLSTSC